MQTKLTQHKGTKEAAIDAFIPMSYRVNQLRIQKSHDAKRSFQCDFNESSVEHWAKLGIKEACVEA